MTRVALVTGCSGGIGAATARLLAGRGWRVLATARDPAELRDLPAEPLRLDLTDDDSIAGAVEQALALCGRIDALVNNAGYSEVGPLEGGAPEDARRQFETNVLGPLRLAQLVLPHMRAQGGGRIVNVGTVMGRAPIPLLGLYSASKAALEALNDALRLETRRFGIRVILVVPGTVKTRFDEVALANARRAAAANNAPYGASLELLQRLIARSAARGAPPETVARVIHRALVARRPRSCYAATRDGRLALALLPRLPRRLRDAALARPLGL